MNKLIIRETESIIIAASPSVVDYLEAKGTNYFCIDHLVKHHY